MAKESVYTQIDKVNTSPLPSEDTPEAKLQREKDKCIRDGGTWDYEKNKCILPTTKTRQISKENEGKVINKYGEVIPKQDIEREKALIKTPGLTAAQAEEIRIQQGKEAALIEQEKQRLIREETPERVELDQPTIKSPIGRFISKIPGFGQIQAGNVQVLNWLGKATGYEDVVGVKADQNFQYSEDDVIRAIQEAEFEKGLTASETVGAAGEAIGAGALNRLVDVGAFLETPSGNANEVVKDIRKERRRIREIKTNVRTDLLDKDTAKIKLREIEMYIAANEARLKLLIAGSPDLIKDSDGINVVETEILSTREELFYAKLEVEDGKIQDPTELQLYKAINSYDNKDIPTEDLF